MTSKGTPGRVVRIDDELWDDYGKLCAEKGVKRATDVRMYITREVTAWRAKHRRRQRAESPDA